MDKRAKLIDASLWAATGLLAVTIAVNSLGSPPSALVFPGADKVFHFGSYLSLTFLLLLVAVWRPGRGPGPFQDRASLVLVAAAAFGALLELGQLLVTERSAHVFDGLANLTGVGLAWLTWSYLRRSPRVAP